MHSAEISNKIRKKLDHSDKFKNKKKHPNTDFPWKAILAQE